MDGSQVPGFATEKLDDFDGCAEHGERINLEDLKRFDVPTLLVHGSADQVVPIDAAARAAAKLIKDSKLLVYEGAPHGLVDTYRDRLNADLLAFIRR